MRRETTDTRRAAAARRRCRRRLRAASDERDPAADDRGGRERPRAATSSRASSPAPPVLELAVRRPFEERAQDVVAVARREEHRLEPELARTPRAGRRAAPRAPAARSSDSPSRRRTSRTRPSAPASGTTMPSTGGKLCSHIGSWTTTGTMSQRCSTTRSQTSRGGETRKSERTNRKLPLGIERRWPSRNSSASVRLSSGARYVGVQQVPLADRPGLAARGRRPPERRLRALREVEVADEPARLGDAVRDHASRRRAAPRPSAATGRRATRAPSRAAGRRRSRRAGRRRRSARAR